MELITHNPWVLQLFPLAAHIPQPQFCLSLDTQTVTPSATEAVSIHKALFPESSDRLLSWSTGALTENLP